MADPNPSAYQSRNLEDALWSRTAYIDLYLDTKFAIAERTFHCWKSEYGLHEPEEVWKLRQL